MLHVVDTVDDVEEEVEGGGEVVDVGKPELDVLVVSLGLVVVVPPSSVVDVGAIEEEVDAVSSGVVSVGATAAGDAPTWESANPTICHVSTVAATNAATHPAAMRHEIMIQIVPGPAAMGSQHHLKVLSRLPCRADLSFNLDTCHTSSSSKTTSR